MDSGDFQVDTIEPDVPRCVKVLRFVNYTNHLSKVLSVQPDGNVFRGTRKRKGITVYVCSRRGWWVNLCSSSSNNNGNSNSSRSSARNVITTSTLYYNITESRRVLQPLLRVPGSALCTSWHRRMSANQQQKHKSNTQNTASLKLLFLHTIPIYNLQFLFHLFVVSFALLFIFFSFFRFVSFEISSENSNDKKKWSGN